MENITLITGPRSSGKSFLAKQLILLYNKSQWFEHSLLYEESIYERVRRDLKNKTDVVVFDEVTIDQVCENPFLVNTMLFISPMGYEYYKRPAPHYILVLGEDQEINVLPELIRRRCNIITCSHVEGIFTYIKTDI